MADAYHLLPLASISMDLVTPTNVGYSLYHWMDKQTQSSSQNNVGKNPTQTFKKCIILVYYNLLCEYFVSTDAQMKSFF